MNKNMNTLKITKRCPQVFIKLKKVHMIDSKTQDSWELLITITFGSILLSGIILIFPILVLILVLLLAYLDYKV